MASAWGAPPAVVEVLPLSDRVLRLVADSKYDAAAAAQTNRYRLRSTEDGDYAGNTNPLHAGLHSYVTGFDGVWIPPLPRVRYEIFLNFPAPLKNGMAYTLTVVDLPSAGGETYAAPVEHVFTFDDRTLINGSVKANHVGYLVNSPKFGYVGNYLGTLGALPVAPDRFEVRRAGSGELYLAGTPELRGEAPAVHGEKVYSCDFSNLLFAGTYYLYVPGVGRSHDFRIGNDVFVETYKTCARGLYYQRCGMALDPAHAGPWSHGACHLNDALIHASLRDDARYSPLYAGEIIGGRVDTTRGWHDAGDYGKYVPTAANTLYHLFAAWEQFPHKFKDGDLNIPESGNGIPDLLDETKWEVDWLRTMQSLDGGVFHKVAYIQGTGTHQMPENIPEQRILAPKTTHSTALYAAVLAAASRHYANWWPEYARDCLVRAERAWAFLLAHPSAVPTAGFFNPAGVGGGQYEDADDVDNRAWAAAELYKATGKEEYHNAFLDLWLRSGPLGTATEETSSFRNHQAKASWTYTTTTQHPTINLHKASYRNVLRDVVENKIIPRTRDNHYRVGTRVDVPVWVGWGSVGESTRYAEYLIHASIILNKPEYLDYAKINLDYQLGNNPQNKSLITGIGYNSPKDPLQIPSFMDGVEDPVPGIPIFGPHYWLSQGGNPFFLAAFEVVTPAIDNYPVLYRNWDSNKLVPMSEFTIEEMAHTTATFGYFRDVVVVNDPSPPAVPQALQATPNGESEIILAWTASTDPHSGVTGYRIYRDGAFIGVSGGPSFTDAGLRDGTAYTYEVAAFNGGGTESTRSGAASGVTAADTAAPVLLSALAASSSQIVLSFSEALDPASATDARNYAFSRPRAFSSIVLAQDQRTVIVNTISFPEGFHFVRVSNVKDLATVPNRIAANSTAEFSWFIEGDGLIGTYYSGMNFETEVFTRVDAQVGFRWHQTTPDPALPGDFFSVRWRGEILALEDGNYTFHTFTDDGVRLWVDDILVIDKWAPQATEWTASVPLARGRHPIQMEYFEQTGGAIAELAWSSPEKTREVIPRRFLYSGGKGVANLPALPLPAWSD